MIRLLSGTVAAVTAVSAGIVMPIHAWPEIFGFLAAGLLLLTFFMRRMAALRAVAMAASVAWLVYGWADHLYPVVALHTILLPLNGLRLHQALREESASKGETADWVAWLAGPGTAARRTLRLWRARYRLRQELATLSGRDLKDTGISPDLVAHEARKWPWQGWHPQLRDFDAPLLRWIRRRGGKPIGDRWSP